MRSPLHRLAASALLSLTVLVSGLKDARAVGATTPFTTVEAEAGTLAGGAAVHAFIIGYAVPTVSTKELEASGGGYVELNATGHSVAWSNPVANANSIVIRNSVPDTAVGGGITSTINLYVNGVFRQAITVSSKQSWVYQNSATTPDDPNGGGMPYHFYNEDRAFITGAALAAGDTIMLKKDAANSAAYYDIDCVDLEKVPAALSQPANSLSVITYGADPNYVSDSTTAIKNCINDARTQGKSVWIPTGKYMVNSLASGGFDLTGVTVNGAGVWYSILSRNIPLPAPANWRSAISLGTNSTLRDVSVDSNAIYRGIGGPGGDDSGLTSSGSNWLVERVWVQHCDAQWMSGSNATIHDSRVADSWADGINLNNGNTYNVNKLGVNLTVQNCFIRGAGDDSIATYSDKGAAGTNSQMDGTKILNNTTVAPYWANGLRVAGGKNVLVQNNLVTDAAANNGLEISTFGTTGQPLESATVTGNVVLRGGGWNSTRYGVNIGSTVADYSNVTFTNNFVGSSRRDGIRVGGPLINLTCTGNVISGSALAAIRIASGVTGTGDFQNNILRNLAAGQPALADNSPSTFAFTLSGNSWEVTNAALGKPMTASSVHTQTPPVPAANAGDGNLATRWSSNYTDNEWISVDLQSVQFISNVVLDWETAYGKSYKIQLSNDASAWTDVYSTTTGRGGVEAISVNASARYVRMLGILRGTGYGYSLWEMAVNVPLTTGNLALGKPVTVSSTAAPNVAGNAVDGSETTRWASTNSDAQWIYVDLQAIKPINHVLLDWEAAYGKSYKIQVSNDASTWSDIYSTTTGVGGIEILDLNASARYVRMLGILRGTGFGYSLWEYEVH